MQQLNINNQKIAYFDNKASSRPIVFVHGNSLSSETFKFQLQDPELNKFRLIALDLPGHGISDPSKEPEKTYSVRGFIQVLIEFIDQLNLHDALFVGHSMGGHLLLSASTKLNSAGGFVIFGTPPLGSPPDMSKYFLANPNILLAYKPDLNIEEIKSLASAFIKEGGTVQETIANDIARAHGAMRGYIGASMIPENLPDEVAIIENIMKPIAIFHGVDDQLVNGDYLKELNIPELWQNEIQFIPNAGHCPQLENPEYFNRKLIEFTTHIF